MQAVVLRQDGNERTVQVKGGVVMASGGFNRHSQKRGEMLPGADARWCPGAGGMGLHTILIDPSNQKRMFIAISAAGTFRTDDGGKTWRRGEKRVHLRRRSNKEFAIAAVK